MITVAQLTAIMPSCMNPDDWAAALSAGMARFGICTQDEQAAFIAQTAFESQELNRLEENLFYDAARLVAVFPREFPTLVAAQPYARSSHALADRLYADKYGNGDEASGDGWTYRGRGAIQITFRWNYQQLANVLAQPAIMNCPDMLLTKPIAALSAAWFWNMRSLNTLADAGQFQSITQKINGGLAGESQREVYWARAKAAFGVAGASI